MLRPKKNSYMEFDDEKKFLRFKNLPHLHNFSNGSSLKLAKKNKGGSRECKVREARTLPLLGNTIELDW